MKKNIPQIVWSTLLMLCIVTPAQAQFFKKLDKAMKKAETLLQPAKTAQSQEPNLVAMPGVRMEIVGIYHDGLSATVDFKISNTSNNVYDLTFNGTNGLDNRSKSQAVGGDSQSRTCWVRRIGTDSGMDQITRHRLQPGTYSLGSFKIEDLGREITTLKSVSIAGLWQANEDNNNHNFRFTFKGPLTVTTPQNTNAPNVYCTMPWLYASLDQVVRKDNNVLFHFTLKNISTTTREYQPTKGYVKDENGNAQYRFGMIVEGKELGSYDRVKLAPGQSVDAVFGILSVPASVRAMSNVLWVFEQPEYFIQVFNQAIGTTLSQTSTNDVQGSHFTFKKGDNLAATLRRFKKITWDYNADFGLSAIAGNWLIHIPDDALTIKGEAVINAIPADIAPDIEFSIDYIKPTAKVTAFERQ